MEIVGIVLLVAAWVAVIVIWRAVAKGNIPVISVLARFVWNTSCLIGSFIPFIGWLCAKMMIEKDESDRSAKQLAEELADEADEWGSEMMAQSAARTQAEQRRMEEQAELERKIGASIGRAARIHGNQVDIGNKTYNLDDVKKKLNIR